MNDSYKSSSSHLNLLPISRIRKLIINNVYLVAWTIFSGMVIKIPIVLLFSGFIVCFLAGENSSVQGQQQSNSNTNQNQTLNLLDEDRFTWKPFLDARVFQSNDQLDLIVDTSRSDETYNRAYMQTILNSTTTDSPGVMSLVYSFKSFDGKARIATDIRDVNSNAVSSHTLNANETTAKFPLPINITNVPLEFRVYIITDGPGAHLLHLREAQLTPAER